MFIVFDQIPSVQVERTRKRKKRKGEGKGGGGEPGNRGRRIKKGSGE